MQARPHPNNGMASHSSPFGGTTSSSSRRTLKTTPQESSRRIITSPLEDQSGSAGLDESEKARPYKVSQATIQNPVSEQHGDQSSGSVRQRASRKTTALPEPPPPMPIDPQPSDLSERQRGQAHTQAGGDPGGAGQSRSSLRSTPGDRSASIRDVRSGKGSHGPPVRDNDKGRSQPGVRPNDPKPPCMLLVFTLAYPYLTQSVAQFSVWLSRRKKGPTLFVRVPYPSVRHFISLEWTPGLSRNRHHNQKATHWSREPPIFPRRGNHPVLTVRFPNLPSPLIWN